MDSCFTHVGSLSYEFKACAMLTHFLPSDAVWSGQG